MAVEVYRDSSGEWRWRVRGRNGRVTSSSGESFSSHSNALRAAAAFARGQDPVTVDETQSSIPTDDGKEVKP